MEDKCCKKQEVNQDVIICQTCGNKITDPLSIRCPRCFSSLITLGCKGGCRGCGQKTECC